MMIDELAEKIASKISEPLDRKVLLQFALDSEGLDLAAAPGMIATLCNGGRDECHESITRLLGDGFIRSKQSGSERRLYIVGEMLGIADADLQILKLQDNSLDLLGAPHSEEAMSSLSKLLSDEPGPVYLGAKLTEPVVFRGLEERSLAGRDTFILMARKGHLPKKDHAAYDNTIRLWKELLESKPQMKRHISILTMKEPAPSLYTSALTETVVRVDQYRFDSPTTRRGQILRAHSNTSVYELIKRSFQRSLGDALPLFEVWPGRYFVALVKSSRFTISFGLLAISIALAYAASRSTSLTSTHTPTAKIAAESGSTQPNWSLTFLAAIPLGLLVNYISDWVKERLWPEQKLF